MIINSYYVGQAVRVAAAITSTGTTTVDPGSVTFWYNSPGNSSYQSTFTYGVNEEVVRTSTGSYYIDIICGIIGYWIAGSYSSLPGSASETAWNIITKGRETGITSKISNAVSRIS
jgi:hypothetical protein